MTVVGCQRRLFVAGSKQQQLELPAILTNTDLKIGIVACSMARWSGIHGPNVDYDEIIIFLKHVSGNLTLIDTTQLWEIMNSKGEIHRIRVSGDSFRTI